MTDSQTTAVKPLIGGNELGDVVGKQDRLVIHHQMTTVRNPHTLTHVGQQQLVEQSSVANHKVTYTFRYQTSR